MTLQRPAGFDRIQDGHWSIGAICAGDWPKTGLVLPQSLGCTSTSVNDCLPGKQIDCIVPLVLGECLCLSTWNWMVNEIQLESLYLPIQALLSLTHHLQLILSLSMLR